METPSLCFDLISFNGGSAAGNYPYWQRCSLGGVRPLVFGPLRTLGFGSPPSLPAPEGVCSYSSSPHLPSIVSYLLPGDLRGVEAGCRSFTDLDQVWPSHLELYLGILRFPFFLYPHSLTHSQPKVISICDTHQTNFYIHPFNPAKPPSRF